MKLFIYAPRYAEARDFALANNLKGRGLPQDGYAEWVYVHSGEQLLGCDKICFVTTRSRGEVLFRREAIFNKIFNIARSRPESCISFGVIPDKMLDEIENARTNREP